MNSNIPIKIFITGGTFDKEYNELNGELYFKETHLPEMLKLGRNYLKKNNVLLLEFNKFGILSKKEFYDKDDMQRVDFAKEITQNDIKKENFIYSFLSSVRQKMQTKKK